MGRVVIATGKATAKGFFFKAFIAGFTFPIELLREQWNVLGSVALFRKYPQTLGADYGRYQVP